MAITKSDISRMSTQELNSVLDEIEARQGRGEQIVNPGRNLGTATSSVTKGVGAEALHAGAVDGNNYGVWKSWRDPALQMDDDERSAQLQKSWREAGYKGTTEWDSFGSFLKDGWSMTAKSMKSDFARKHQSVYDGIDPMFLKARGMGTGIGEDGGFLVIPEVAPTIDALFDVNDLPGRVDTLPTNSTLFRWPRAKDLNRNDGFRHGGVMHHWVDEAAAGNESRPRLTFTELRMKKLVIFVFMTTEIMNDTPYAVEQFVRNAVREEINFALSRAIMWGGGGPEPLGFARSGSLITVPEESGQAVNTFVSQNALKMSARLHSGGAKDAIWLHHQSVIPQFGSMTLGSYPVSVNIQQGGITNPVITTLLDKPRIQSELCSPLGSPGDVFYLNPKGYKAITQSGVREDVSIHVEFMTDQHCLRFIVRFDGAPLHDQPITPYKSPDALADPETQSAFIRCADRTS